MRNNYIRQAEPDVEYAGFWVRLAAYCIDVAIVWLGLLFVNLVLGIVSAFGSGVLRTAILFRYTVKDILLYVLQVLYFILLTHGTGTTPGKRLLNLRVVNADGSQELDLLNVIYRETIGRFLCGLSVGIGYIMAGVDREKRGLHDMLCDTRVVYAKKVKVFPVYQAPGNHPVPPPGNVPVPPPGNVPVPPPGNVPVPPSGNVPMPPSGDVPMPPSGNVPMPPRHGGAMDAGNRPIPPQNNGAMEGDRRREPGDIVSKQEVPIPDIPADASREAKKDS